MTRKDVAEKMAEKTGLSIEQSEQAVIAFIQTVTESVHDKKSVYLRGFGTFMLKLRKEKKARNISKGTTVLIPAREEFFFKPSKSIKFL
jgi:DNA-binding protein HU-beta